MTTPHAWSLIIGRAADAAAQRTYLDRKRRSVRTHTPDQFNKGSFARRSGIEQEGRSIVRLGEKNRDCDAKIDIGKAGIVARPIFGNLREHGAQNLATLNIRGVLFRFVRFRVERTLVLLRGRNGEDGADRAMIGDRDPGQDRHRHGETARASLHAESNRRDAVRAQIFSSGPTASKSPAPPRNRMSGNAPDRR